MKQVGDFVSLPSGHTSSCIQDCKYIWTGGPARRNDQLWLGPILGPGEPGRYTFTRDVGNGRPIWVTDLTNPRKPEVSDKPIDIWRNDGYTDYSHDVDEDDEGIAWVSGRGGIRGYATEGYHRDPYTNRYRKASPFAPVLVAGGGVAGTAQPVMLMHNSGRPTDGSVRASGVKRGNVLVGTEEDFTTPCGASGKIVLSDLTDSWGGEPASQSSLTAPYRMAALDTFHPFIDTPETANPALGCSAHYFEIEGSTLGAGWYGQGLRLLDIGNARDVRQVGYYRVTGTDTDDQPVLELVGHGVQGAAPQGRPGLPVRHEPRRRDPAHGEGRAPLGRHEVRDRAEREGGPVRGSARLVADRRRRHGLRLPAVPLM